MKSSDFNMSRIYSQNVGTFHCCFLGIAISGPEFPVIDTGETFLSLLSPCFNYFGGASSSTEFVY